MDISIIVDKSSFQSFSYKELIRLTNYYKHNITPVLVMEILGDLKKEEKDGKSPSKDRVVDFATKLFPMNTIVNMHYAQLLQGELTGNPLEIDGRPMVPIEKMVVNGADGTKGSVVQETAEERSIFKWREGKFTDADHELSNLWRTTTTEPNLLINIRDELKAKGGKLKISGLSELDGIVTSALDDPGHQQTLLLDILKNSGLSAAQVYPLLAGWHRAGNPQLKEFIPYSYHCRRVDTLFYLGLQSDLISTRPTNKVDLEYLYYLPFCLVFTSNDNLHRDLAPLLIRKDQKFISGVELKEDLKAICAALDELPEEERKSFKSQPPVNPDSLTFQLWKEYFGYPERTPRPRPLSVEEQKNAIAKMEELLKASEGKNVAMGEHEEGTFITRKTYLSQSDPCYCGSGKKVVDCCIPAEKFRQIAEDQWKKGQS